MPSLGADMEAGTVVEWRVGPGDAVHRGDVVTEVETEKGLIEVEIWEDGVVESILVNVGDKVPVGAVLAMIRPEGVAPAEAAEAEKAPRAGAAVAPAVAPVAPQPKVAVEPRAGVERAAAGQPAPGPERLRVSPRARRRAEELGVDLTSVSGTGESGAITEADVEQAVGAAPRVAPAPAAPRPAVATPEQQAAMRHAISAAMARSKREIPHYYLGARVDMSRALAWLTEQNLARPVTSRLLYSVLLLKAVALAVREVPEVNGFYTDGAFHPGAGIHVGVAISLRQGGLVAPAIRDSDRLTLAELMARLRDLVQRARAGVLRSSEVADGTITVTNLGELGVETVFGVIYPPQVALVGFGKVVEQPWAERGMVGVRPVISATLAADHRVSDGHRGGRFLTVVERLLQEPEKL
jgi:pyruvate dehydrogenase E2 component (dihydrolipoamide acetyltransferase)